MAALDSDAASADAPPLFIRLLVRHSAVCLLLWMAVPIALAVVLLPVMEISEPLVGWRVKADATAEAVDMLALALHSAGPGGLPECHEVHCSSHGGAASAATQRGEGIACTR